MIIGIAGSSGTGKTTVAEGLVARLSSAGLPTGYVKHAPHGFDADRPGSDSARVTAAGAAATAVVGAGRVFLAHPADDDPGPVCDAFQALGCRIVLVEGYHGTPWPKVVAVAPAVPERETAGEVIARVRVVDGRADEHDLDAALAEILARVDAHAP